MLLKRGVESSVNAQKICLPKPDIAPIKYQLPSSDRGVVIATINVA